MYKIILRWYEHAERMNNERMSNKIVTAIMEGIKKRRQWKRLTGVVEEDLKILGIRSWNTVARDWKEWRRLVLRAKVHNRL